MRTHTTVIVIIYRDDNVDIYKQMEPKTTETQTSEKCVTCADTILHMGSLQNRLSEVMAGHMFEYSKDKLGVAIDTIEEMAITMLRISSCHQRNHRVVDQRNEHARRVATLLAAMMGV